MPHKYKLTIAYDGTHFGGWQIQPNTNTIQEEIEKALALLLKQKISVVGSGRTDAGVHALFQVAHFTSDELLDLPPIHRSLNGILPHDIRITSIEKAPENFHARYSAKAKEYHYHLSLGPTHPPFKRLYSHHMPRKIDIDLLKRAAAKFVGTHDFKAFANQAYAGAAGKNSVRTIYRLEVIQEGDDLRLEFEGNGFLYKMVRNIVGTLLGVCEGKISIDEIEKIFTEKNRKKAGRAASARGLFLVNINYE